MPGLNDAHGAPAGVAHHEHVAGEKEEEEAVIARLQRGGTT